MHFVKRSAATNELIIGRKFVEPCQAYVLISIYAVLACRREEGISWNLRWYPPLPRHFFASWAGSTTISSQTPFEQGLHPSLASTSRLNRGSADFTWRYLVQLHFIWQYLNSCSFLGFISQKCTGRCYPCKHQWTFYQIDLRPQMSGVWASKNNR
jgi:hypothetical protein